MTKKRQKPRQLSLVLFFFCHKIDSIQAMGVRMTVIVSQKSFFFYKIEKEG